jgi:hypothetical protein
LEKTRLKEVEKKKK